MHWIRDSANGALNLILEKGLVYLLKCDEICDTYRIFQPGKLKEPIPFINGVNVDRTFKEGYCVTNSESDRKCPECNPKGGGVLLNDSLEVIVFY
jgi:hypothetical protein